MNVYSVLIISRGRTHLFHVEAGSIGVAIGRATRNKKRILSDKATKVVAMRVARDTTLSKYKTTLENTTYVY